MTTTDARALLAAILAEPEDNGARLAYADLLEECGEPERAEFIRVQLALTAPCRLGYSDAYHVDDVCAACDTLRQRERELFSNYRLVPRVWLAGLPVPEFDWGLPNWSRGFLWRTVCTTQTWLSRGPTLVRLHPVTRVELSDREPADIVEGSWSWAILIDRDFLDDYRGPMELPDELIPHLPGRGTHPIFSFHPTREAALSALSAAALAWARATDPARSTP